MERQDEDREVEAALHRALFAEAVPAWYLALFISCGIIVFFHNRVSHDALLVWGSAAAVMLVLRLAMIYWVRGRPDSPLPVGIFTVLMGLTGMLWGSIMLLWNPQNELVDQFVIALIPLISTVGVIVSLGYWPVCYQTFMGGVVAGLLLSANGIADESYVRLLAPLVFTIAGCLYSAYRFHQQIRETQVLRLRNQRALQSKDEFLARMSHELRTPMNGVLGMVRMLVKTPLNNEQQSLVKTLSESGEDMLSLVSDLLDAASLASHDVNLVADRCDLGKILQETVEGTRRKLANKPIVLTLDVDEAFPPFVLVDSQRWRQIAQKLLSNAVKFTEQGEIVVRLSSEGDCMVLSVRDTGCGIPASDLETVRQLFHQVHGDARRRAGGSGIGLTIVEGLVDLMDGTLQIDSELGKGTVVTVRAPLNDFEETAHAAAEAANIAEPAYGSLPSTPGSLAPVRALVAEDNPVNQLVIEAALEDLGCDITLVENGLKVLLALQASSFDIIFMDCQMPELDGYEATRQARENGCSIPIIAVTANALAGDRERCLEAGMDDYLSKPIAEDALQQMLDKWLQSRGSQPPVASAA